MASATLPDAPAAAKRPSGLNPRTVFSAVRRRPLAFIGVLLLTAAAAAAVWFLLPLPKLTAAVGFHLSPPRGVMQENAGGGDMLAFKNSQAARVKSRLVLNDALNKLQGNDLQVIRTADPDPLTWLDRNLKVDTKAGPDVLRVVLEGDDGDELTKVLGAVSKAYLEGVDRDENGRRRDRLKSLTDEYDRYQKDLVAIHNQIDTIVASVGRTPSDYENLDRGLQLDYSAAATKFEAALARLEAAKSALANLDDILNPKPVPPADGPGAVGPPAPPGAAAIENQVDRVLSNDPVLLRLRGDVAEARQKLDRIRPRFQEGAPDIVKAEQGVREAERRLAEHRADRRKEVAKEIEEAIRGNAAASKEQLQARVAFEQAQVDKVQKAMKEIEGKLKARHDARTELERLKRNSEIAQSTALRLGKEKDELTIELKAPIRVSAMEAPFVLPGLEGNRRMKFTLVAAAAAFLLGFGALVGWEARGRRVTHTDDVTTDLGVRLLGTVPPTGGAGGPGAPPAALAEAIDTARTMLLHGTPGGPAIRTVLVTSGVAGEGKTSLAGHLSISLARAGFRTVLVDGDLQSPSAHRLFDCPVGPGLCELLRDEVELDDAARPTPLPGLALLPAGRWDTAARQALVGDRWRRLKADLEARYDFVVVDSAPLLLVSDTLLLAREADGVVLSVLLGVSQVSHVAETAGRLQAVGAKLTGAVVNGVWHRAYRAGSAYRYAAASPAGAAALGDGGEDRA